MKAILFLAFLILAISATSTAYVIKHEAEAGNLVKRNVEADRFGNVIVVKRDEDPIKPIISAVRNLVTRILPPKPQQTNNPNVTESNNPNVTESNNPNVTESRQITMTSNILVVTDEAEAGNLVKREPIISAIRNFVTRILPPKPQQTNNPNVTESNNQNMTESNNQNVTESNNSTESRQITIMPVNISMTDEAEAGNLAKREPIISAVRNLVTRILPPKPQQTNNPNVSAESRQITIMPIDIPTVTNEAGAGAVTEPQQTNNPDVTELQHIITSDGHGKLKFK